MAAKVVLESLLVSSAVKDEPPCSGIADTVAEDNIQSEEDFVDEVIHVAFKTAIIIAGEDDPLPAIEKNPARELN